MRMDTWFGKPSSKESDTDKKENLGKKGIRLDDTLHQTKAYTLKKHLDYVELEVPTSSFQDKLEEWEESRLPRLIFLMKYLEDRVDELGQNEKVWDKFTLPQWDFEVKYHEAKVKEMNKEREEWVKSTLPRLESKVEWEISKLSRWESEVEWVESMLSRLESRLKYLEDKLEQDEKKWGKSTLPRLEPRMEWEISKLSRLESRLESDKSTLPRLESKVKWGKSTLPRLESRMKYHEAKVKEMNKEREEWEISKLSRLESRLEWDKSTLPSLESKVKHLEDRLNKLEQDVKNDIAAVLKRPEEVKTKYHEAKLTEVEIEKEDLKEPAIKHYGYRKKYHEAKLKEVEKEKEEWEEPAIKHYGYRKMNLAAMLKELEEDKKKNHEAQLKKLEEEKKVQSIDSTQGFAIPPPSLSAPMTIPDGSQAQAVEKSSGPRSMMTEQRSTAARKQGLIAVQNLPFGMIRNIVYHYLYQKNRVIAGKLLMYMSVFIRSSNDDYIDVWPAYRESAEWNPVFVILCQTNFQGEWDEYAGFQVFKRRYDFVSSEAAKVFNSPIVQNSRLELNGFLTKCISDTDLINTHSNITIVNACPVRSRNGGRDLTKETCIVIHCRGKGFIPFTEQPFPKMISTLPVDVREGYFVLGMQTPDPERNVAPSGNSPEINNGTSSNNAATNDFQPFDTSVQTAQNADLNGHSAASAVNSSFSSSNNLLSNGSQANGDVDMTVDPCRLHEMNVDDLCQEASEVSLDEKLPQGKGQYDFNETLLMGTSISRAGRRSSGTLGGFVSLPNGNIGFLTCAHVLENEGPGTYDVSKTNGVPVFVSQPSDGRICAGYKDRQRVCGSVERAVFEPGAHDITGVDAALVKITDRRPNTGEFIKLSPEQLAVAGFGRKNPLKFSKGKIMTFDDILANRRNDLIKVGSTTGVTRGSLYLTDTYVRLSNPHLGTTKSGEALAFFNQMEVSNPKFCLPGDSGALVFMPLKHDELHCMGLVLGYTSYASCLVTPIEKVFEKLELKSQNFFDFSCGQH